VGRLEGTRGGSKALLRMAFRVRGKSAGGSDEQKRGKRQGCGQAGGVAYRGIAHAAGS